MDLNWTCSRTPAGSPMSWTAPVSRFQTRTLAGGSTAAARRRPPSPKASPRMAVDGRSPRAPVPDRHRAVRDEHALPPPRRSGSRPGRRPPVRTTRTPAGIRRSAPVPGDRGQAPTVPSFDLETTHLPSPAKTMLETSLWCWAMTWAWLSWRAQKLAPPAPLLRDDEPTPGRIEGPRPGGWSSLRWMSSGSAAGGPARSQTRAVSRPHSPPSRASFVPSASKGGYSSSSAWPGDAERSGERSAVDQIRISPAYVDHRQTFAVGAEPGMVPSSPFGRKLSEEPRGGRPVVEGPEEDLPARARTRAIGLQRHSR